MTNSEELAVGAIRTIYDLWKIDANSVHWVGDTSAKTILSEGYGFDWWPGDFKVEVRVGGPHPEIDYPFYRLSVRTDFLCDVDVTTVKSKRILSDLNRFSPTFAICAHPTTIAQSIEKYGLLDKLGLNLKSSKVWLESTAYVHDGTKGWLPRFFAGLAILQPIESQFRADLVSPLLGGRADRSRKPGHEARTSLDDILSVEEGAIAPQGTQQSKWIGTGEFDEIIEKWGRCDSGFGFADEGGLSIEMPFGDETAILTLKTDVPHPRLGNGLLALLKIPHLSELERINELSIEMNYLEAMVWSKVGMPLIGNWCADEYVKLEKQERGFVPAFSSFVPNLFYQRGLAENIILYATGRTWWVRQMWMPDAIDLPMHEILSKRLNPGKVK